MALISKAAAAAVAGSVARKTGYRFYIMFMLFFITTINYADRSTLSITGAAIKNDLRLDNVTLGYLFSAFAWSYTLAQLPGGWLLDKIGYRKAYFFSLLFWAMFTFTMGFCASLPITWAIAGLFVLRVVIGAAEAPIFPANNRANLIWFPRSERGTTAAVFTASQYFAKVCFAPLMGFITQYAGWPYVYWLMGVLGVMTAVLALKSMAAPGENRGCNQAERDYIEAGGGQVGLDSTAGTGPGMDWPQAWCELKVLARNRMMIGIMLAQYCLATLTAFFLTWLPLYLIEDRHMSIAKAGVVAAIPALTGFFGGVLGGVLSDRLLASGGSITFARKFPIVLGMLISVCILLCNYLDNELWIITAMAVAFFGKALGTQGWSVLGEVAPYRSVGMAASLLNGFGSIASIISPIVIGYLIQATGNFQWAFLFVALHGLVAALLYLCVVGPIKRIELNPRSTP
ncbi:MFS transporter [Pseudomonas typographi]|uniref:MFS transporter n=1 Tax=Pseudomonas typographi TaxID=2715964 RepID=A0ABR7Z0M9_9PSED|nr:MFS transporter [Pseudomonas typographi]MBD1552327.1 MFS transporter [Pseudomonas typographi]MBD1589287.1 MFS transporter [Pseudomonas typographi]MBD1598964.1 MFS transporter [Pseudomonas typographi]